MKKRRRLKKPVRRILYGLVGSFIGLLSALSVNAAAPITSVTISPDKISIEDYEYFKQSALIKVTMPESVQQIGFSGFEGCTALTTINLPSKMSVIDNRAFAKCSSLKKIDIPESTVFIGNAAFYGCDRLDGVVLPSKLTEITNNMFYECDRLTDVTIPESVTKIGQQSFYGCRSLRSLSLPSKLTSIDDGAFYDCAMLQRLDIPDSVTEIGLDAFEGCNQLTIVCGYGSLAEKYAEANNIKHKIRGQEEVMPVVAEISSELKSDTDISALPVTAVDTPYEAALIMLLCCTMVLFAMEFTKRRIDSDYTF